MKKIVVAIAILNISYANAEETELYCYPDFAPDSYFRISIDRAKERENHICTEEEEKANAYCDTYRLSRNGIRRELHFEALANTQYLTINRTTLRYFERVDADINNIATGNCYIGKQEPRI